MKSKLLFLLVVPVTLWAAALVDAPEPEGKIVGRYQLVLGTFPVEIETSISDRPAMFRIDTATGLTWRLRAEPTISSNGMLTFPQWSTVEEPGSELRRLQQHQSK